MKAAECVLQLTLTTLRLQGQRSTDSRSPLDQLQSGHFGRELSCFTAAIKGPSRSVLTPSSGQSESCSLLL